MSENTVFKKIKKGDVLASFFTIALAAALAFALRTPSNADTVYITYSDRSFAYPLYEDKRIEIENNGVHAAVIIENGRVGVESTDCKNRICIEAGSISSGCIICVPGGIVIRVGEEEHDVIAG